MATLDPIIIPFVVSMIGLAIAIVERGWKRFKDEQATNPQLKFNTAYLLNMLLTAGGVGTLLSVISAVIASLTSGETSLEVTLVAIASQFALGYLLAYRILDAFNNRTDKTIEAGATS